MKFKYLASSLPRLQCWGVSRYVLFVHQMLCLDSSTDHSADMCICISWSCMIHILTIRTPLQNYHSNNIHNNNSSELRVQLQWQTSWWHMNESNVMRKKHPYRLYIYMFVIFNIWYIRHMYHVYILLLWPSTQETPPTWNLGDEQLMTLAQRTHFSVDVPRIRWGSKNKQCPRWTKSRTWFLLLRKSMVVGWKIACEKNILNTVMTRGSRQAVSRTTVDGRKFC